VILGKNELLGVVRRLLEHGRLRVRSQLPLADAFKKELAAFDPNPPRIDKHDPEAWRERPNDDLVYAIALATWWPDKHPHTPKALASRANRIIEEHNTKWAMSIV
jgi:hypothetical protein